LKQQITTGSLYLDRALDGGLPLGEIVLVYGEAETGKTSLAIQCAVNSARMGFKTLYVDCEGFFTPERLSQIAFSDLEEVSDLIILVRPSSFREQIKIIDDLEKFVNRRFGLIVFDTVTSLYRSVLSQVRSLMQEFDFAPVARRILKFWSSNVVKLSRTGRRGIIRCLVEKSRGKERRSSFFLSIEDDGIHDYESRI